MSKSRMTAFLLLAFGASSVVLAGPGVTADQAMETYRRAFQSPDQIDCPRGEDEDIVVCGRRTDGPDPNRLPLPVAPDPGTRVAGESVDAVDTAGSRETCSTVSPNQNCAGGLPVFAIVGVLAKVAAQLVNPDD